MKRRAAGDNTQAPKVRHAAQATARQQVRVAVRRRRCREAPVAANLGKVQREHKVAEAVVKAIEVTSKSQLRPSNGTFSSEINTALQATKMLTIWNLRSAINVILSFASK
jgi:hypothetical protein